MEKKNYYLDQNDNLYVEVTDSAIRLGDSEESEPSYILKGAFVTTGEVLIVSQLELQSNFVRIYEDRLYTYLTDMWIKAMDVSLNKLIVQRKKTMSRGATSLKEVNRTDQSVYYTMVSTPHLKQNLMGEYELTVKMELSDHKNPAFRVKDILKAFFGCNLILDHLSPITLDLHCSVGDSFKDRSSHRVAHVNEDRKRLAKKIR